MLPLQFIVTCGFSVWRLDLNVVFCAFLEFVGLLVLCRLFAKTAAYLREKSNLELTVGMTHTYSCLVIDLNSAQEGFCSLNDRNTFTPFQNTFYSAGKNYLLRMCNGEL